MNSKAIVREIMTLRNHSYATLAKKLGYVNSTNGKPLTSGISERLRGTQEMRVDTLVSFLEALDCELIIKSTTTDKQEWTVTIDEKVE